MSHVTKEGIEKKREEISEKKISFEFHQGVEQEEHPPQGSYG